MSDSRGRKRRKNNEAESAAAVEASRKLAEVQKKIAADAQDTLNVKLPAFILELDDLMTEFEANVADALPKVPTIEELAASKVSEEDPKKVEPEMVEEDATFNRFLQKAVGMVRQGTELIGLIKTWIQLNIPRIEDGNNFGVAVQEECASELSRLESVCFAIIETSSEQLGQRAKLAHKMTKHNLIHDYHESVMQNDTFQRASVRMTLLRMRNGFMMVHDLLTKNQDRILKPRQSDVNAFIY
mmetsp:Transcript_10528/g.20748  ORF Transcript_10528/g.20748 Transcript_10528/m.20748 type:complete len:242 (+) Transcript_10528:165-890(+)|eukprot:CAMPEP_0171489798 /NCGR_PEP_ID=MMETSP0958-20121227/2960_1 /TAXON_ID=87120 /ORGANISM="Aurantiochytrium limacinum, Strain ATCCMYA-1381" /LENGTH=241 /DNA_ID=CAMNT_0012023057 /DNA_START=80 /DNA_END=805 /DNA_ORIENTATION=+